MSTKLGTVRERAKSFFTAEEGKTRGGAGEKIKKRSVCMCVLSVHILGCIQRLSTQLPACVPAHERSAYSPTCVSNERWTALLSILSSKISHDVTMNPSWTHLCQKALLQPSLSRCLIFCSTSPSFTLRSCLSNSSLSSHSFAFSYFRILQHFPSPFHVSSLSLSLKHTNFFFLASVV